MVIKRNYLKQFIKTVVDRLFNHFDIELKFFKQQFDPEVKEKERRSFESRKIFNPFNKNEIDRVTKNINNEMEKSAEKFYSKKEKKTMVYLCN